VKIGIVVGNMPHHVAHAEALATGLARHGIETDTVSEGRIPDAHTVACWGWRLGGPLRKAGKEVLVMERGFIERMRYTSLGWNGLNGTARRDWPSEGHIRLHTLFPRALQAWNPHGMYVLIVGQVPGDAAVAGVNLPKWYAEAAAACAKFGPIRFRPHPVAIGFGLQDSIVGALTSHAALQDDLRGARVVVTWNSNAGVDALLAGKPTIVRGSGSMASIAAHDWSIQGEPYRTDWASQLAWSQFSMDEIRSGYAWDVIKDSQTEH
jgi:hypothetical protein